MPQYRIEVSPNNRAGCKDKVCKDQKVKLLKGEIRFGTWVEIDERGSWHWKHWGCVSGSQLVNLQEMCDQGDGKWDWDAIDGYDELTDKDVLEKVRRCVKQGHIDPEDFNGDPEKNVPGQTGIHLTAKQREKKEAALAAADGADDSGSEAPKKAKAKRARAKANDSEGEEEEPPRAKKAKKSAQTESVKGNKPTKPTKSAKAKKEAEEEQEEETRPAKPARGRKAAVAKSKKQAVEEESEDSDDKPITKAKGKRTSKARKAEPDDEEVPVKTSQSRRSSGRIRRA